MATTRGAGEREVERAQKNTVHVYSVNRFVRHPAAIAHVTGWCIGGPCGSVCDRRESRRYTSDTASRGRRHLQETTRRSHSGLVRH